MSTRQPPGERDEQEIARIAPRLRRPIVVAAIAAATEPMRDDRAGDRAEQAFRRVEVLRHRAGSSGPKVRSMKLIETSVTMIARKPGRWARTESEARSLRFGVAARSCCGVEEPEEDDRGDDAERRRRRKTCPRSPTVSASVPPKIGPSGGGDELRGLQGADRLRDALLRHGDGEDGEGEGVEAGEDAEQDAQGEQLPDIRARAHQAEEEDPGDQASAGSSAGCRSARRRAPRRA